MKTEFQALEWAIPKIKKQFNKNPRRSLSATFRSLRNNPRLSQIGDYPLLSLLVNTVREMGIEKNRNEIRYAFNQSRELKSFPEGEKKELIDQLLNPNLLIRDSVILPPEIDLYRHNFKRLLLYGLKVRMKVYKQGKIRNYENLSLKRLRRLFRSKKIDQVWIKVDYGKAKNVFGEIVEFHNKGTYDNYNDALHMLKLFIEAKD